MQMTENEVNQEKKLNLNKFLWIADNEIYNNIEVDLTELDE